MRTRTADLYRVKGQLSNTLNNLDGERGRLNTPKYLWNEVSTVRRAVRNFSDAVLFLTHGVWTSEASLPSRTAINVKALFTLGRVVATPGIMSRVVGLRTKFS